MLGARPSSTPLHHQCEGRPPAFQASRATRATNRAVASAACLEGPRGARYPICGCIERPAFPAPSIIEGHRLAKLGRIAPRECGGASGIQRHCERSEAIHLAAQRKNGLLRRGACHRGRIRATRWLLAMMGWTAPERHRCARLAMSIRPDEGSRPWVRLA